MTRRNSNRGHGLGGQEGKALPGKQEKARKVPDVERSAASVEAERKRLAKGATLNDRIEFEAAKAALWAVRNLRRLAESGEAEDKVRLDATVQLLKEAKALVRPSGGDGVRVMGSGQAVRIIGTPQFDTTRAEALLRQRRLGTGNHTAFPTRHVVSTDTPNLAPTPMGHREWVPSIGGPHSHEHTTDSPVKGPIQAEADGTATATATAVLHHEIFERGEDPEAEAADDSSIPSLSLLGSPGSGPER